MNLFRTLRRLSGKTIATIAVAGVVVAGAANVMATSDWGPGRDTFTINNPATHVTFNSMTDNPVDGDERNFVRAKDAAGQLSLSDTVQVKPGQEYVVRMVVHNNAAENLGLVATNTTVKAAVPATTGKSVDVTGFVSADNAKPGEVWDSVRFTSDQTFNLAYVAGSAKIYNQGYAKSGAALPDSIVTSSGAKIGYEKAGDGKIPGCFEFLSYVEFKVKPQFAETADFTMSKTVRAKGESTWSESINAKAGQTVQYRILFRNTSTVQLDDVTIRDQLPAGVSYVPGTTNLFLGTDPNNARKLSDNVTGRGVNIGSYAAGGVALVIFDAKVNDAAKLECGKNTLRNVATASTKYGSKSDDATVTVSKECEEPAPEKVKVCDLNDKTVKHVTKEQYEANPDRYTTDLDKCKEKPQEGDAIVCDPETGKIITVKESERDNYLPKDSEECKEKPVVEGEVTELPQTGFANVLTGIMGLGALTTASYYYIASRRV